MAGERMDLKSLVASTLVVDGNGCAPALFITPKYFSVKYDSVANVAHPVDAPIIP